jgi:hypothetical protein
MIHQSCTCASCTPKTAPGGASAAALGNITVKSATESKPLSRAGTSNHRRHYDLLQTAAKYLPDYRVSSCQQIPVGFSKGDNEYNMDVQTVSVGLSDNGTAKYGGLNYCGGIWLCPVCARNVAPTRVAEVTAAMARNAKKGGQSLFLTFTFPHSNSDSLKDLWTNQRKAMSKVKACGTVKRFLKKYGYLGEIRALEVTHGNNGWHPHFHCVYLFDNITINKHVQELEDLLYLEWAKQIHKLLGRTPSQQHGIDVKLPRKGDEDEVGSYIAKWGQEITMSHTKRTWDKDSRTPFDILGDLTDNYTAKDHALWMEFAEATFRTRRLYWTPGLKDLFNIDEIEDKQLAEKKPAITMFDIKWRDYKALRNTKMHGAILDILERHGPEIAYTAAKQYSESWHVEERKRKQLDYQQRKALREQIYNHTMKRLDEMFPNR